MNNYQQITREEFMHFFRDDEKLNDLTPDDRIEIFRTILIGNSDITKELLNELILDYSVHNLEVLDTNDAEE